MSFFKKLFQKHYQCQMVWIEIRTDILLGLIWVQTFSKGYQQATQVAASKGRGKLTYLHYVKLHKQEQLLVTNFNSFLQSSEENVPMKQKMY